MTPPADTVEVAEATASEATEELVEEQELEAGYETAEEVEEYEEQSEYEEEYDSQDILSMLVEVDGEEKTVDEIKNGYLRHSDYTRKTQALAEERRAVDQREQHLTPMPL